jgi:hypothetical protein
MARDHLADMQDQITYSPIFFPEVADADGRGIEVGMKDRCLGFATRWEMGKAERDVDGYDMVVAALDFSGIIFVNTGNMVCDFVFFRGIAIERSDGDKPVAGELPSDLLIDTLELLGRCRHGLTPVAGKENCGLNAAIISTSGNNTKKKYSSVRKLRGSDHHRTDRGKLVPADACGYKETGADEAVAPRGGDSLQTLLIGVGFPSMGAEKSSPIGNHSVYW